MSLAELQHRMYRELAVDVLARGRIKIGMTPKESVRVDSQIFPKEPIDVESLGQVSQKSSESRDILDIW
jgi:hypothetical protein